MFAATRRWFRRNRTPIAIGLGVVGAGYVATQYILNKLNDARERMSSDRIAKENLRRRFQQNQEDCTYTVLALLPTATAKILEAMDVERITLEIQQMKGAGGSSASRSVKSGSGDSMSLPETTGLTDEDGRSMVSTSESGVHASQITIPPASQASERGEEQPRPEKPRRTKRQLWGDVTISSITRAYTLIYTLGLLTMLTRVQLNLLGRRSYLSSVVSLATGPNSAAISLENNDDDDDASSTQAYGDDFEVNRKYLTFSWWLLNRGWADVMQRVEAAVRQVFGQTSPRDQLSLETFAAMTGQVRRLVEGSAAFTDPQSGGVNSSSSTTTTTTTTTTSWLSFLLPPPDMEDHVLRESGILDDSAASVTQTTHLDGREPLQPPPPPSSPTSTASLRRLLDETSDLIESPTFAHVLTQILDAGFSTLLEDKLATGAFEIPPPQQQQQQQQQQQDQQDRDQDQQQAPGAERKKVLLPRCLSVLTRQAHAIGSGAPPNEYLQAMESVRDLEGFAAVVYSSNWDTEIRDEVAPPSSSNNSTGTGTGTGTGQAGFATAGSSVVVMGPGEGEESLVLVDPSQSSFESAWVKATGGSSQP